MRNKRTIVRNMSTKLKSPINWLFPDVRKRVLALLLGSPEERWYLRDIARRTGCALGTVRRELAGLADAEIVRRFPDGNRTYYQANTESPIFEELHGLIVKTAGLVDVVRAAMEPLAGKIDLAFIYGSQAGGEATAGSDVDLLIVYDGPKSKREVDLEIRRLFWPREFSLDILILSSEEMERTRPIANTLAREVSERGVLLYG